MKKRFEVENDMKYKEKSMDENCTLGNKYVK